MYQGISADPAGRANELHKVQNVDNLPCTLKASLAECAKIITAPLARQGRRTCPYLTSRWSTLVAAAPTLPILLLVDLLERRASLGP